MFTTIWKFSRPHTIIGTFISIFVLFFLSGGNILQDVQILIGTLISSLTCNIFITGLNQIIDRDLDAINKPELPIPAGMLTLKNAKKIVVISIVIALIVAFLTSLLLFFLIVLIASIGMIYSLPPFQLKRHHIAAALAITLVRGFLVNIGMSYHFSYSVSGSFDQINCLFLDQRCEFPIFAIWPLTLFVLAFSLAIAWYKDLSDISGDKIFGFKTFPILYSPTIALKTGGAVVLFAFIYNLNWFYQAGYKIQFYCFLILFLLYIINLFNVKISDKQSIKQFYKIFWLFFFGAYLAFGSICFESFR